VKLAELAAGVAGAVVESGGGREIGRILQDSRQAGAGDLFVALAGLHVDGHDFAAGAARRGAAVALQRPLPLPAGTAVLRLPDTRRGLAELAAELHGRPARRLLVAGVTGTDGKTTVTHLAAHALGHAGLPAGFLSTVAMDSGGGATDNDTGLSTTEAPAIQEALAGMVAAGRRVAVVEATSHALSQGRVVACELDVAAFTHVGHDHLDYHRTWEDYVAAKATLIDLCREGAAKGVAKTAVLNRDDASYPLLCRRAIGRRLDYSLEAGAELRAGDIELDHRGSSFRILAGDRSAKVRLALPARYNVANALCAAGICMALGVPLDEVAAGLSSFAGLRGRLEQVDLGQPFGVYIDYAHSAGSLGSALSELRAVTKGRVLAVFGANARADHDSRGMGSAAAQRSDWFVITTDDPVDLDPADLARQVETGATVSGARASAGYEIELDRRAAIRLALGRARPGDAVLLAGKGHERFMMLAGRRKQPWDERGEAEAALRDLGYGA
jgi:UDP-N-acetylmuramoyl-L-alanyl-D-glutamate--2,6-diaminopimelate ligase